MKPASGAVLDIASMKVGHLKRRYIWTTLSPKPQYRGLNNQRWVLEYVIIKISQEPLTNDISNVGGLISRIGFWWLLIVLIV